MAVALASPDNNSTLDYYLTQKDFLISALPFYNIFRAYFPTIPKADASSDNSFEKIKIIGDGGFSTVYLGNH